MKTCYLCGSSEDLTRDHIPPKNLFPSPRPTNLITVDCCKKCNGSFSKDDEAFRIFVSSAMNRSPAGAWIWSEKVMGSSFKRSPRLKENVKNELLKVADSTGKIFSALKMDKKRADNYLIRITKGLIKHYMPNIQNHGLKFETGDFVMTQQIHDTVLMNKFSYLVIGDRVFRCWVAFSSEDPQIGLCVYTFYDAHSFFVSFEPKDIK